LAAVTLRKIASCKMAMFLQTNTWGRLLYLSIPFLCLDYIIREAPENTLFKAFGFRRDPCAACAADRAFFH